MVLALHLASRVFSAVWKERHDSRKIRVGIFLLTTPAVWAQYSKADLTKLAADRFDMAVRKLNLRSDQVAAIKPLILSNYVEMGQMKDVYRGSDRSAAPKKDANDSLKAIDVKYNGQINTILSPEQAKVWKRMQKDWKDDLILPKS